jgi:hypothetical protein
LSDVFISFIHQEEFLASAVGDFLNQIFSSEVGVFQSSDRTAVYAGEDWMALIFEKLKSAKVLISMLSPESVGRPWINFEAGAAWMRGIKVIPVLFNGLTIDALPKPYSSLQAVEIDTIAGCYYLATSTAHHLGRPKPIPTIPPDTAAAFGMDPEQARARELPYHTLADTVTVLTKAKQHGLL